MRHCRREHHATCVHLPSWSFLLILHSSFPRRFRQNFTISNENNVFTAEFLLQLADQPGLYFLELRPVRHRDINDDRLNEQKKLHTLGAMGGKAFSNGNVSNLLFYRTIPLP